MLDSNNSIQSDLSVVSILSKKMWQVMFCVILKSQNYSFFLSKIL